jgi:hypothetical protein
VVAAVAAAVAGRVRTTTKAATTAMRLLARRPARVASRGAPLRPLRLRPKMKFLSELTIAKR